MGVHSKDAPGDVKCVTRIFGGREDRKLGKQNLKLVDIYV